MKNDWLNLFYRPRDSFHVFKITWCARGTYRGTEFKDFEASWNWNPCWEASSRILWGYQGQFLNSLKLSRGLIKKWKSRTDRSVDPWRYFRCDLIGWAKLNFLAKTFCWRCPYWLSTFTDAWWAIMWSWSWCSSKTMECCFKCSKSWCCSAFDVAFNGRMCCTLQQTCNHGQWKIQMPWRVRSIWGLGTRTAVLRRKRAVKILKMVLNVLHRRSGETPCHSKTWVWPSFFANVEPPISTDNQPPPRALISKLTIKIQAFLIHPLTLKNPKA